MATSVDVTVLFFARSRELAGTSRTSIKVADEITAKDMKEVILTNFPSLREISNNVLMSYNQEYLDDENEVLNIKEGDEVAIIPPLGGG